MAKENGRGPSLGNTQGFVTGQKSASLANLKVGLSETGSPSGSSGSTTEGGSTGSAGASQGTDKK